MTDQPGEPASAVTVLVVGDGDSGSARIAEQLAADGFAAHLARSPEHARSLATGKPPHLVVLGDLGGVRRSLDLLAEIRTAPGPRAAWDADVPVIVIGARAAPLDVLRAFELGADDVLGVRAGYLELRARVRAVLRRSRGRVRRRVRFGRVDIDPSARAVAVDGKPVRLSRLEYELLSALAAEPGRVFTREELLRGVWGFRALGTTRTLDSHASRLRRKLGAGGGVIVNVWGVGYRLAA